MSYLPEYGQSENVCIVNSEVSDRRNTFYKQMRQNQMSQMISQRRNFDCSLNNDKLSMGSIGGFESENSSQKSWPVLWSPDLSISLGNDGGNSNGQQVENEETTPRRRKSTLF